MNKTTTIIGMIKPIQSEDVPLGLFLIFSRAAGNMNTMNIINANAETICIQSTISVPFKYLHTKKPRSGRGFHSKKLLKNLETNHHCP